MHQKSEYSGLIHDAVDYHLVESFAFGYIKFEWVYAFPYITIVDRITRLYLEACEESDNKSHWKNPFRLVDGDVKFEYGTPYIANIIYGIAEFYEFKYNTCMKCPDHGTYCGMDDGEVRICMQRANDKYYADLAAPSWDD